MSYTYTGAVSYLDNLLEQQWITEQGNSWNDYVEHDHHDHVAAYKLFAIPF